MLLQLLAKSANYLQKLNLFTQTKLCPSTCAIIYIEILCFRPYKIIVWFLRLTGINFMVSQAYLNQFWYPKTNKMKIIFTIIWFLVYCISHSVEPIS